MAIKQPDGFNLLTALLLLLFSLLGAIAKMASATMKGEKLSIATFCCQLIVSLFSGGIAVLISSHFNMTFELAGALAGTAGWMGAEFTGAVASLIKSKAGVDND